MTFPWKVEYWLAYNQNIFNQMRPDDCQIDNDNMFHLWETGTVYSSRDAGFRNSNPPPPNPARLSLSFTKKTADDFPHDKYQIGCCFSELKLKIQVSVLVWYKVNTIIISLKINLFSRWYSRWVAVKQQSKSLTQRTLYFDHDQSIKVITKLPNSQQSYKGKVKTHNYINRQNQSTTGKLWKP